MRIPDALAELGVLTSLKIESGDYVFSFEFPKSGKNIMILATDSGAKTVYGLRGKLGKSQQNFVRAKVADRYSEWSEYAATTNRTITISAKKTFKVGKVISLSYSSDKWDGKHDYFHDFETSCFVHMDCDEDPETIVIKGRSLKVTPRGIEG
jgi:hypothetical protein